VHSLCRATFSAFCVAVVNFFFKLSRSYSHCNSLPPRLTSPKAAITYCYLCRDVAGQCIELSHEPTLAKLEFPSLHTKQNQKYIAMVLLTFRGPMSVCVAELNIINFQNTFTTYYFYVNK
jgi:hypothetical protein